jgi:hypothetical protein
MMQLTLRRGARRGGVVALPALPARVVLLRCLATRRENTTCFDLRRRDRVATWRALLVVVTPPLALDAAAAIVLAPLLHQQRGEIVSDRRKEPGVRARGYLLYRTSWTVPLSLSFALSRHTLHSTSVHPPSIQFQKHAEHKMKIVLA